MKTADEKQWLLAPDYSPGVSAVLRQIRRLMRSVDRLSKEDTNEFLGALCRLHSHASGNNHEGPGVLDGDGYTVMADIAEGFHCHCTDGDPIPRWDDCEEEDN